MPKKIRKDLRKFKKDLAEDIVDSWDMDALVEYAIYQMTKRLSSLSKKEFEKEWDDCYGKEK